MQVHAKRPAPLNRQQYFDLLLIHRPSASNTIWLSQIVASWLAGEGVLPDRLGLSEFQFQQLQFYFCGYQLPEQAASGKRLDFSRMLEKQDMEQLLQQFVVADCIESEWLISIIVAACLGSDHLWQDLGLWSRAALSAMLNQYFPALAVRNSKDMKWKKFLYKQLCEADGLFVCRAPSCEVCQDYPVCFGPEE